MQFYSAVLVVIGIVGVFAIESGVHQLPIQLIGDLEQDLRPLVVDSNQLSTDGYDVYPGQFPYHARLFTEREGLGGTVLTDGSLITPNYILTRAAGRNLTTYGYAILGIGDGSSKETQQKINFSRNATQLHPIHDIATVRLDHPVTFTKYVQPIRLPRLSDSRTYEMMEGTNVGMSYQRPAREGPLIYLRNQIMSNDGCNKQHPYRSILSNEICTNAYVGGALCGEVYGSGLIVEDENGSTLVGVMSAIYGCDLNYPMIFYRLSEYREWISTNSDYVFDF
ncbi:collagenase-like [Anopheles marshallii]|uniref:collagenase-like n=1 Tax=Anopheles marshallii TaxID=1521116 RepID=UPI00237AA99C|nr:collagenase-like [Anopheles marshallii]